MNSSYKSNTYTILLAPNAQLSGTVSVFEPNEFAVMPAPAQEDLEPNTGEIVTSESPIPEQQGDLIDLGQPDPQSTPTPAGSSGASY